MSLSVYVCVPCIDSSIEEGNPDPCNKKEDDHERESEDKPWAKIDQVTLWEVTAKHRSFIDGTFKIHVSETYL